MSDGQWRQATKVLCIRLDNVGDVLMMTPAIRALTESVPGRRVTLMASSAGAAAARFIPEISRIIEYAAPWMKDGARHEPGVDRAMLPSLESHDFDAAVIFTTYSQSPLPAALLCHMAGIPLRLAHCRENPYRMLTHWLPEPEPHDYIRHEVRRQLDLVAAVGCRTVDERMSFQVPAEDFAWIRARLLALGIDADRPFMVLHPGASAASRRYPPNLWTRAARMLAARVNCPLVFTGSADETELVERIATSVPRSHSLAGQLDLGKLAAAISLASVAIAGNTGPAHIAAAVGTPLVDLYALTNPQHTPWRIPSRILFHDVPCRFCYKSVCPQGHHDCLRRVPPAAVADAAFELMHAPRTLCQSIPLVPLLAQRFAAPSFSGSPG